MAFDFDIEYVKGITSPHVDALSRLKFNNEPLERSDNSGDKILHWIKTDILPLDCLTFETLQDLVSSKNEWIIKRNK